jgi:deoxyribonuclease-4
MIKLGAHMSIAGGYYKAVEAAGRCGMEVVQLFTKNNNQWRAKEIAADEVARFQATLRECKVEQPLSHASYLINLASGNAELWDKSVAGLIVELQRAEQLGIAYVVVHPGAHPGIEEEAGLANVVRALDAIHTQLPQAKAQILLETTAGQGSSLGHRFEQLASMIQGVRQPERLGVCVDTCHIFAAGYRLIEKEDYLATFREFETLIGLDKIRAFHLNDSKKPLGSRVDRHEHIGHGTLGLAPFAHLMNDKRFRQVPMYLETPKEMCEESNEEWDVVNLRTLRGLMK